MEEIIRDDVMMIGSPSSEGKMVIKLKIPRSEEGKRVCLECKKEFSSGKALGGHMRVHIQSANKNPNFLKPSDHTTKFNNGDDEGKPKCSQCGKTFPSMKSLFGHMRCHPERVWRGILPPPTTPAAVARRRTLVANKPNSSASCNSLYENSLSVDDDGGDDRAVDLMKFLRGWSVTERRGRKALKAADDDGVLLEAAEDLMTLANDGADMIKNFSDNESDSRINIDKQVLVNYKYKIKRRKKMKLMMELEQNAVVTGGATPLAPLPEQQQEEEAVSECKYKCTTCNKCFATHQALGGHRSSHNKSKLTSTDDHRRIEEDDYLMNQSGNNSSQITSTGSGRKVFDFDLNEIPADGNGYASSSYNSNMG